MGVGYLTGDWDYGELPANVVVGRDCYLERQASFELYRSEREIGLSLGDRVRAYTWTAFNVEPSGMLEIGEDAVLVGAVFMCADHISVGKRSIISYQVTIADSDFHPRDAASRREDARANAPEGDRGRRPQVATKPVVIEEDVWIGIGAIVLKGVTIGRGARVGPGAIVTSDVPECSLAEGNPARIVGPVE